MSEELTMLLYKALGEDYGLRVKVSHPANARTHFLRLIKESIDPDVKQIKVTIAPTGDNEVWLIKVPNGQTQTA